MTTVRDRLTALERIVGARLECDKCSLTYFVVVMPDEDPAPHMPAPCSKCGRERTVVVVRSPLPTRLGFQRAQLARDAENDLAGSLRIDEPDPGKVIAPPVPEASPVVAVDANKTRSNMNMPAARWAPRSEWRPEQPAREEYDPLSDRWR
jgi:hypothetical protein